MQESFDIVTIDNSLVEEEELLADLNRKIP